MTTQLSPINTVPGDTSALGDGIDYTAPTWKQRACIESWREKRKRAAQVERNAVHLADCLRLLREGEDA